MLPPPVEERPFSMSHYDDYDQSEFWSVEDDPAFKEAAAEWAANNFDDLQARYAEIDVERKMIDAHRSIWSLAQRNS